MSKEFWRKYVEQVIISISIMIGVISFICILYFLMEKSTEYHEKHHMECVK